MIKKCPVCLKVFEGRRDKVCCSKKCSQRKRRTPSKSEQLNLHFSNAHSAIRFIGGYTDDPFKRVQALNLLFAIIRGAAAEIPYYLRVSLGKRILESVNSRAYNDYVEQRDVRLATRFNGEGGVSDDE